MLRQEANIIVRITSCSTLSMHSVMLYSHTKCKFMAHGTELPAEALCREPLQPDNPQKRLNLPLTSTFLLWLQIGFFSFLLSCRPLKRNWTEKAGGFAFLIYPVPPHPFLPTTAAFIWLPSSCILHGSHTPGEASTLGVRNKSISFSHLFSTFWVLFS